MTAVDFAQLIGDPDASTSSSLGMPSDPNDPFPPAGLSTTVAADQSPPSLIGGIYNTIADDSRSALDYVEAAPGKVVATVESGISSAYGTLKNGVSTVVSDVSSPLGGLLKTSYWYLIGAVAVIGAVIYFAGKSGALRITR